MSYKYSFSVFPDFISVNVLISYCFLRLKEHLNNFICRKTAESQMIQHPININCPKMNIVLIKYVKRTFKILII